MKISPFRIIFYLINLLLAYMFVFLVFSDRGIRKNDELRKLVKESGERYEKALQEYNDLKRKIELFENNVFYQKMVIHKEIGYIEDNERIYIFEE